MRKHTIFTNFLSYPLLLCHILQLHVVCRFKFQQMRNRQKLINSKGKLLGIFRKNSKALMCKQYALPQHYLYKQNWYGDDCLSTLIWNRVILTIFNLDLLGIQIPSSNLSMAFLIFNGPKIQFCTFSEKF